MPVMARLSNARAGARSAGRGGALMNGQRWHDFRKPAGARVTNAGGDARLGFQISNATARVLRLVQVWVRRGTGSCFGGRRRRRWGAARSLLLEGASEARRARGCAGFRGYGCTSSATGRIISGGSPGGTPRDATDSAQEGAMTGARRMRGSTRRLGAQRALFTGVQRG